MMTGGESDCSEANLILIGCGVQARYVEEIATLRKVLVCAILDPFDRRVGERCAGREIEAYSAARLCSLAERWPRLGALVCLSDNGEKRRLYREVEELVPMASAIHPGAVVATTAKVDQGTILNALSVVQSGARVGRGCMIHAGVVIEHDCEIGDFANLAPGVALAGGVRVGGGTTVFSGAVVAPGVSIGEDAVIGAGAVVRDDIPAGARAWGVPARVMDEPKQ